MKLGSNGTSIPGCKLVSVPLFSLSGLYLMALLQRQGCCLMQHCMEMTTLYPCTSQGSHCYPTGLSGH